jgi:uncharacterized repeat protein (TIGR01451 family)
MSIGVFAIPAGAHDFADIEVKKTAAAATIQAGDDASFTISVLNNGPAEALEVELVDHLPGGLDWFEAPDTAQCSITDGTLVCDIGTLAPGAFFQVRVKALTTAEDCGPLVNTATATAKNEPAEWLGNNSASASILVECPEVGEGCTPGFWKNHTELWDGVGTNDVTSTIQTTDLFNATFGVTSAQSGKANSVSLLQAIGSGGGGLVALGRHATAGLVNADSGVNYGMSVEDVIALYRDAVGADPGPETVSSALAILVAANERVCPLG